MTSSFGGGSTALILCYIFYGGHIIHVGKMVTGDLTIVYTIVYTILITYSAVND